MDKYIGDSRYQYELDPDTDIIFQRFESTADIRKEFRDSIKDGVK